MNRLRLRSGDAGLWGLALFSWSLAGWLTCPTALGQGRQLPPPPPSRPTLYDPDRTSCEPDRLRSAVQQQLIPYADQSEAVLEQLRALQQELTRNTLRRCVARELITRQQADQLFQELTSTTTLP